MAQNYDVPPAELLSSPDSTAAPPLPVREARDAASSWWRTLPLQKALSFVLGPAFPFLIVAVIAFAHGQIYRWVCDDAFISFRYAKNFANGDGLVYSVGERVEGYTNFLWVVELAGLHKLTGLSFSLLSQLLSALLTVGTFVLTLLFAFRGPVYAYRYFVAVVAVAWLALNRNVAVWSSSGLETRQFTFLVLLGVWLAYRATHRPERLFAASLAFAGAALTRPEGPLLFAGFCTWYLLESQRKKTLSLRSVCALVLPFVLLVGSHFIFRRVYYGDWLPNTYYAKHVRAWPDMGIHYYTAVVIESGLYLAIPLAFLGGLYRWAHGKSSLHQLALLLIAPHVVYLIRIGGDHFEFRPLDFYWPFLALAAAEGLAAITLLLRLIARRLRAPRTRSLSLWGGSTLAVVVGAHAVVFQIGEYSLFYDAPFEQKHVNSAFTEKTFPLAHVSPLTARLAPVYDASMEHLLFHAVAVRHREHERFSVAQRERFGDYGKRGRRKLPKGTIMAYPFAGIAPFQFPEVTFIDTLGLTDRTIARNGEPPNANRAMAHDRHPPAGYLDSRGVNIDIQPAVRTRKEALERASFAVELADNLWMPFESGRPEWVKKAFADFPLHERRTTPKRAK